MKLTHITLGQAGLHADDSAQLSTALAALMDAGYTVSDIEDDPSEPWHVATVHYSGPPVAGIRAIKDIVGLPYPGKKNA